MIRVNPIAPVVRTMVIGFDFPNVLVVEYSFSLSRYLLADEEESNWEAKTCRLNINATKRTTSLPKEAGKMQKAINFKTNFKGNGKEV